MRHQPENSSIVVSPRNIRWLAVAALGILTLAQLALANHQFAHDELVTESCVVCVQLDQFETTAIAELPHDTLRYVQDRMALPADGVLLGASTHGFSSRAPPSSLIAG